MEPFFSPILLVPIDTKFRKFTRSTHYHDDTARKHSIRRVGMTQRRRGERREREKETRQIRYIGIAAATRAARGVRPFIGGCPALLSTPLSPSASQHPRTPSSFSLFRSPL